MNSSRGLSMASATTFSPMPFFGTHTDEGGPLPPTGKSVRSDYVYVMSFDGDKISHLTKIWPSDHALRQLGWM